MTSSVLQAAAATAAGERCPSYRFPFDKLSIELGLTDAENDCLESDCDLKNQVFDYLNANLDDEFRYEASALAFAKEVVRAVCDIEGGDVNFENQLIYNPVVAQNYKASMSNEELSIFNGLTMAQQEGYLRAAVQAYIYSEINFPQPVRNRKGDAFKNTLWNALITIYIGEALTEQLTTAHENIPYNYPIHFIETEMDFQNNAQGRQIANDIEFFGNIRRLVEEELIDGRLRYLNSLVWSEVFNCFIASDSSLLIPTN